MRRSQLKASVHRPRIGRKRPPREADVEQVVSTDNSNSKRKKPARDHSDLASHCEAVARIVWGKPSSETATELRWGMHGSRVVNRAKGIWFDHEHGIGGGTLDLALGATKDDRLQWLRDRGIISNAPRGSQKRKNGGAAPSTIIATYDYNDESGVLLFQVVRRAPKDFRQRRPNGKGGWTWSLGKTRRVLYRLPELRDAVAGERLVIVVEGEKDADNLRKLGFTATCNAGGANKWRAEYNESLRDADVVIIGDNDDPGRAHVAHVASSLHSVARRVRVFDLAKAWSACPPKGDISDWIEGGGTAEALNVLIEALPEWAPATSATASGDGAGDIGTVIDDDAEIERLAKLPKLEYDREREDAAARLGVRVATLDNVVRDKRASAHDNAATLSHWRVEPSPVPVDGTALLDRLRQIFRRYIVLPKGADIALALWVLHAWTYDAGDISPFVVLVSPTKGCGKTSVLILLQYLTPRSELASNISAAALFRYIEKEHPTLLIDEADSFVKDDERLRGILNSGHTKTAAYVIRTVEVNGDHQPHRFSTWAPKAIATIRALADTLEDRAVVVQLQRKPPGAKVERLRRRDNEWFEALRSQAARWAADNFEKLVDPDPQMPEALNDRAADNWRPLVAIADLVGGEWPQLARQACLTLSGESAEEAMGVMLLADCGPAFGDDDVIRSIDLVAKLGADPERPWAEYNRGKPITQRQVAKLLGTFGIISINVRPKVGPQGKGYRRIDFEEAWASYCPDQNSSRTGSDISIRPTVQRPLDSAQVDGFTSVPEAPWDGSKNGNMSNNHAGWDAGTLNEPQNRARNGSATTGTPSVDPGDIPECLRRHRCDHCGSQVGITNLYDWPCRPDGIWLHPGCEGPWFDSERGKH
jgi:putative DNA primase/helicase